MNILRKKKVLAYITRRKGYTTEILIHSHFDMNEAGLQIPAGTVENNESIKSALFREIHEESGINDLDLIKKLSTTIYYPYKKNEIHDRHYFLLETNLSTNTWKHAIKSHGEDNGLIFEYNWYNLDKVPKLAAKQDELINEVLEYYKVY